MSAWDVESVAASAAKYVLSNEHLRDHSWGRASDRASIISAVIHGQTAWWKGGP